MQKAVALDLRRELLSKLAEDVSVPNVVLEHAHILKGSAVLRAKNIITFVKKIGAHKSGYDVP